MKKTTTLLLSLLLAGGVTVSAQDYDDDIYYNPKKDKGEQIVKDQAEALRKAKKEKEAQRQSYYIKDMANMDVDAYNRRGQYYVTPVDTIGNASGQGEDFVYTQQLQKFYNPTIVVDNANQLADILNNSVGNVQIVVQDNGNPWLVPSAWGWGWPYYSSVYSPYWGWDYWGPSWSWNWNWNWGPSWAWGPSWSWGPGWGWGPSWAWGPSWGWGPGWGWGPVWGGGIGRPMADYRPHGNRPVGAGSGWSTSTRPAIGAHRTLGGITGTRPGMTTSNGHGTVTNNRGYQNNNHRTYNNTNTTNQQNRQRTYQQRTTTRSNNSGFGGGGFGGGSRGTGGGRVGGGGGHRR